MKPIAVRYNRPMSLVLFTSAIFVLATGLLLGDPLPLFLGVLNGAVGLGFLLQPWFIFDGQSIQMRNILGMTLKTHAVPDLAKLAVGTSSVHYDEKKLFGGGWLASAPDWAAFREASEHRTPA